MFSMIGILVGLIFRPKGGNRVIKFLPNDKRFINFDIAKEYAFSVRCKLKKGYPVQRFIKLSSGWSGYVGSFLKKSATLFLGVQGTAFSYPLKTGKVTKDHAGELLTIDKVLSAAWGSEFYNTIPQKQRDVIKNGKINVTVDLGDPPNTSDLGKKKVMSEEDLKTEEDKAASETFWLGRKIIEKGAWVKDIFILGTGIGIALALQILGILKI